MMLLDPQPHAVQAHRLWAAAVVRLRRGLLPRHPGHSRGQGVGAGRENHCQDGEDPGLRRGCADRMSAVLCKKSRVFFFLVIAAESAFISGIAWSWLLSDLLSLFLCSVSFCGCREVLSPGPHARGKPFLLSFLVIVCFPRSKERTAFYLIRGLSSSNT
jgi:hypothetical protein